MTDQAGARDRVVSALRRWWPVLVIVLTALVVESLFERLVFGSPKGHAADHLQSAGSVFLIAAMFAIILWATPTSKRTWAVWLASGFVLLSLLPGDIGNYQVVDALRGTDYSDEEVEGLDVPGLDEGHALAYGFDRLPTIAAALLAAVLWRRKIISLGVAIAAAVFSVLVPPGMIPAFGVVIIAFATCRLRAREQTLAVPPPM